MGSDRARRSYDAGRMYRSVVSQQGRVTLEADANEAEEIGAEESRRELIDVVGPCGAPDDGFKISVPAPTGGGFDFAIGSGTLYVGGVRVDQRNARETYEEQRRNEWVEYPIGRHDGSEPGNTVPFTEAVYLTITEQEISAVEDRALREVALGGPDTAARTRLIQRVQRMSVAGAGCEAAFDTVLDKVYRQAAVFDPATMRVDSRMRLRVQFDPDADDAPDACQPTKQSGFLGADNQLIRVQVSSDGRLLWGWDNASFLYRVKMTSRTTLDLEGVPVDVYHQPRLNQWVEVLGTAVDLGDGERIACDVGQTRQVAAYDPTERTVTLQSPLPASFVDSPPPQVFVRMWERQLPFPATTAAFTELVAADGTSTGIRVFTNDAAKVPGDYWMIGVRPSTPTAILPARLAELQPPDGPRRWVTALAVVAWIDEGRATVTDCRPAFLDLVELTRRKSGSGCCELVVAPGEDIQAAIDSLPAQGGSVCLKAGTHQIRAPIRLDKSGVTLHGESGGTVVESAPPAVRPDTGAAGEQFLMLDIQHREQPLTDLAVYDISFVVNGAESRASGAFVGLTRCSRARVNRCRFTSATSPGQIPLFTAVVGIDCTNLTIAENRIEGMGFGILAINTRGWFDVRDNTIRGLSVTLQDGTLELSISQVGIMAANNADSAPGQSRIEHNRLDHYAVGIMLGSGMDRSSILENTIRRGARPVTGPIPRITDAPGLMAYLDARSYGITCASNGCVIRGNRIEQRSAQWGGIRTVGRQTSVEANAIEAVSIDDDTLALPAGIYCSAPSDSFEGAHQTLVCDNVLTGPQAGITVSRCNEVEISRNHIDGAGRAWYGVRMEDVSGAVVKDNRVRQMPIVSGYVALFAAEGDRNHFEGNHISWCRIGIFAIQEADVEVSHNSVEGAAEAGIWLLNFARGATICGNRVVNCGYQAREVGLAIRADALKGEIAADSNLRLEGCEIVDTGIAPGASHVAAEGTIGISGTLFACQLVGNVVGYTRLDLLDAKRQHLSVSLLGPQGDPFLESGGGVGHALVVNNSFTGRSPSNLVMVLREQSATQAKYFGRVTFNNNICRHVDGVGNDNAATVVLAGGHLIAMGNHVEGDPGVNSMSLDNRPNVALVGNVTTGRIIQLDEGSVVPNPYTAFNVQI